MRHGCPVDPPLNVPRCPLDGSCGHGRWHGAKRESAQEEASPAGLLLKGALAKLAARSDGGVVIRLEGGLARVLACEKPARDQKQRTERKEPEVVSGLVPCPFADVVETENLVID